MSESIPNDIKMNGASSLKEAHYLLNMNEEQKERYHRLKGEMLDLMAEVTKKKTQDYPAH